MGSMGGIPRKSCNVMVVVPGYNEGAVLADTLSDLCARGYSVVVVDDGSSDNTAQVVSRFPVHYVRHRINLGQGAALETGTRYALRNGADVIVHFDADGQHPAEQIPALIRPIVEGTADVAMGSRFLRKEDALRVPAIKRAVLRLGTVISAMLVGVWLTDTHNGFRALSRRAAERISFRENGFAHATELLQQIRRYKLRHVETPCTIAYTEYSRQKGQSIFNSVNIVTDILISRLIK